MSVTSSEKVNIFYIIETRASQIADCENEFPPANPRRTWASFTPSAALSRVDSADQEHLAWLWEGLATSCEVLQNTGTQERTQTKSLALIRRKKTGTRATIVSTVAHNRA